MRRLVGRVAWHEYRWPATIAITLLVAAATIHAAVSEIIGVGHSGWSTEQWPSWIGWPLVATMRRTMVETAGLGGAGRSAITITDDSLSFVWFINVGSLVSITLSTCWVTWTVMTTWRRFQYRLSSLLTLMFAAAVVAALVQWEREPFRISMALIASELGNYSPITARPWWVYVPVLYGVGCVSVVVAWVATDVARAVIRR